MGRCADEDVQSPRLALVFALITGAAHAAGPLRTTDTIPPVPYTWDMSNGPIPVCTDGGGAFTYNYDGVTPFITIERANEITQFAFDQWNNVETATFEARRRRHDRKPDRHRRRDGGQRRPALRALQNGYGFWVIYDTDGKLLENYFGVLALRGPGHRLPRVVG